MPDHRTQITVYGDMNKVYDIALQYWPTQKFSIQNEQRPNLLIFNKSGTKWTTDIRKVPQDLHINLIQEQAGTIKVNLHFNVTISGVLTKSDIPKLESDVMAFKNLILTQIPQQPAQPPPPKVEGAVCPKCGKSVSPDFTVCPYCSQSLKRLTCPSCAKEVSSEFAVCPFCGTKLN